MGKINIEVGSVDDGNGHVGGYAGTLPPLTTEQRLLLEPMRFRLINPHNGPAHSQTVFPVITGEQSEQIMQEIVERGKQIADVLRAAGHAVEVDENNYYIGKGYHFFGGHVEQIG